MSKVKLGLVTSITCFEDKQSLKKQVDKTQKIITNFKTYQSSEIAVSVLTNSL